MRAAELRHGSGAGLGHPQRVGAEHGELLARDLVVPHAEVRRQRGERRARVEPPPAGLGVDPG